MNRPVRRASPSAAPLALQDAKARFSEVVEAAIRGEPQHVTRRGKPAVVIVGASEFERLSKARQAPMPSFIDYLLSMPRPAKGRAPKLTRIPIRLRDVDLTD